MMKRLFAALLCCMLLMSMASVAFAEMPTEKVTILVNGYELGAEVSKATIELAESALENDRVNYAFAKKTADGYEAADGETFKAGTDYSLHLLIIFNEGDYSDMPDEVLEIFEEMMAAQLDAILDLMDLSVDCTGKEYTLEMDDSGLYVHFIFHLPPFMPATGDGANLALWMSMLAVSAAGVVVFTRKTGKEY